MLGKRVITATEMLESMINNIRPTRAEISDVANAVYDGTSAIMLSGETAAGKYPVQAVEAMSRIALETEKDIRYDKRFRTAEFKMQNVVDAISHAVCGMSIDIGAKVIVVCSLSGRTVRMVSRFRAPADILGVTTDVKGWRKLALSWGVTPALSERFDSTDVLFFNAKARRVRSLAWKRANASSSAAAWPTASPATPTSSKPKSSDRSFFPPTLDTILQLCYSISVITLRWVLPRRSG